MLNYEQNWSQSKKSLQISSKLPSEAEFAVMSRAEKTQDIQNVIRFLDWDVFEQF